MLISMTSLMAFSQVLAFGLPSGGEWIILLVLGLLIFGRRLPDVGRSLGRGIVEFKKGIKGIEEEIEDESSEPGSRVSPAARKDLPRSQSATESTGDRESVAAGEPRTRED